MFYGAKIVFRDKKAPAPSAYSLLAITRHGGAMAVDDAIAPLTIVTMT
jgi:hypothetical protein